MGLLIIYPHGSSSIYSNKQVERSTCNLRYHSIMEPSMRPNNMKLSFIFVFTFHFYLIVLSYSKSIIKTIPGYAGDLPFKLETGYDFHLFFIYLLNKESSYQRLVIYVYVIRNQIVITNDNSYHK